MRRLFLSYRHRFVLNPSFSSVEDLNFGRMAFLGMNPEIEKMAANEKAKLEEQMSEQKEKDIQDEDMAEHYQSVVKTVGKKFVSKREATSKPMMSDTDAETMLAHGNQLLHQIKSQSKGWKQKKKKDFIKPKL